MTPAELGSFARDARKDLGLTQQDLANIAGVSERFVRDLEAGKPSLHLDKTLATFATLGYDLVPTIHNPGIR